MIRAGHFLLFALAASAIALAGCGEERVDPDRSLSKREYISRANDLQSDANTVFAALEGRLAPTPATAKVHLDAFDRLIAGYEALQPPRDWRDEHDQVLESLAAMRQSMLVVSRASARNRAAITAQVARYDAAQQQYVRAVRSINASR